MPGTMMARRTRVARLWRLAAAVLVAGLCLMPPGPGRAGNYLPGPRDSYKIFVIGDSLAGGLWAGLARLARDDERISVSGRFKEDSGLARPEIYNWPRALNGILERNQFDIAVVMIGANDGRDIRKGAERLSYGSPEWIAAYKDNMAALLAVLKRSGVAVYWIGLPPMLSRQIDDVATTVTALQREAVDKAGIRFLDIRAQFANADGSYAENGFDLNGEFVRLRSRNGVNLLRSGNDKLASILLEELRRDIEAAQEIHAADEAAHGDDGLPATRRRAVFDGPVFGKALANGEVTRIEPGDLPSRDAIALARRPAREDAGKADDARQAGDDGANGKGMAGLAALRLDAQPGSHAERLLTTGQSPPPQPGRIDDFSIGQPAE
jgi:hypothetical protein